MPNNLLATARTIIDTAFALESERVVQCYNLKSNRNTLLILDESGLIIGGQWDYSDRASTFEVNPISQYQTAFDPSDYDYWRVVNSRSELRDSGSLIRLVARRQFSYCTEYRLSHVGGGFIQVTRPQYLAVVIAYDFTTVNDLLHRMTHHRGFNTSDIYPTMTMDSRLL